MIVTIETRMGDKYDDEFRGRGMGYIVLRDHGVIPLHSIKTYKVLAEKQK